jgi:hypothetical protein
MLQDHFHPPLSLRRHWHAFHNAWATFISSQLNSCLPKGYFAEPNVQFGIEIDVATFQEDAEVSRSARNGENGGSATSNWSLGPPTLTIPMAILTDVVEVLLFANHGGPTLSAAIELVSPANKDRESQRDAFASKCAAYLQQGVGLLIVDVVTERNANLHDELVARFRAADVTPLAAELYTVAYRPVQREEITNLDTWIETLSVGHPLPTMPLWLRGGIKLPVELNLTYERTCTELRIAADGD